MDVNTKIKGIFEFFDASGNGTLEKWELSRILELINPELWTDEKVEKLMVAMDTNKDGRIQYDEFVNWCWKGAVGDKVTPLVTDEEMATAKTGLAAQGVFDRHASEDLLEQAANAHHYKGPMKERALKLLDSKADPNFADRSGSTVLIHMAAKVDVPFAKRVLDARADINKYGKDFLCPIFVAAARRDTELLRLFLMPETTPIEDDEDEDGGVMVQRRTTASTLSADPDGPSAPRRDSKSTALIRDMAAASVTQVGELIQQRADLNHKDSSGWTPLTMASFVGRPECVDALITWGGESRSAAEKLQINQKNKQGRSALHIAARKDMTEILSKLLSRAGDPNVRDIDGWTPLHHACFNGNSKAAEILIDRGASTHMRGFGGLTPFQVTRLKERPGDLSPECLKLIKPSEDVDYGKCMLPILKDSSKTVYDKIDELLSLPGVCQNMDRLCLHDQFFDPVLGPSKVKLTKVWSLIIQPLLRCLRTGDVGMAQSPGPHLSDEARDEHMHEVKRRRDLLRDFATMWMEATKGPRPSVHWGFDNRGAYKEELEAFLSSELSAFREELDAVYAQVQDADGGDELVALPVEDVQVESLLTQLGAHPSVEWLENLDAGEAFEQLRLVGFITGDKDEAAAMQFAEMLTYETEFHSGRPFWRNIYRKWLEHYAKMATPEFHRRIKQVVEAFNEEHEDDGLKVSYAKGPLKTYDRMKEDERNRGLTSSAKSLEGRTTAASSLDIVRGTITAPSPSAILEVLARFRELDPKTDKFQLVQTKNFFNESSDGMHGYRYLELNVLFRGGLTAGACNREGKCLDVAVVGEVAIVLPEYVDIKKRRSLQYKLWRGFFDWGQQYHEEDGVPPVDEADARLQKRGNAGLYEDDI